VPDRPTIAILDYGIGNLHSAQKRFEHAGADARLTAERSMIEAADGVVLPGVGAFGPTVDAIRATGLADLVHEVVASDRPFMGICVGMQVLFASSEEAPDKPGLGVFDRPVRWLSDQVKRPQMQWNVLDRRVDHPMFAGLPEEAWVYFVHSLAVTDADDVIATCDYGGTVVAASARANVWTAQFHPEKSGRNGLQILANFVDRCTRSSCP
jgi:glutamine amidotransferase